MPMTKQAANMMRFDTLERERHQHEFRSSRRRVHFGDTPAWQQDRENDELQRWGTEILAKVGLNQFAQPKGGK